MIRRQARKPVASEIAMAKQFGRQFTSGEEDNKPPLSMSGRSPEPRKPLIDKQEPGMGDESRKAPGGDKTAKKTDEKTKDSHYSCSLSSCSKSGTDESDKVWEDKDNEGAEVVKVLEPVNTNSINALDFYIYLGIGSLRNITGQYPRRFRSGPGT